MLNVDCICIVSFDTVLQPSTKILNTAYSQILLYPFEFGFFYSAVGIIYSVCSISKTIRIGNIICSVWGTYVHLRLFEQSTKDFGSKIIHF